MTTLEPSSATGDQIAVWSGDETGLEDFENSDLTMPRLVIDHAEGKLKNQQTDQMFDELIVVLLGLHKGRIMWGELSDGADNDPPLCKSPDTKHGFPNMDENLSVNKRFPWDAQKVFSPTDAVPLQLADGEYTLPQLPCKECHFKEWNTDPTGRKPWCSEEWTFPLLYQEPDDPDSWVPSLFTVRRSGIKPARTYVTPFAQKRSPLFMVATKVTLEMSRKGSVKYGVPKFTKYAKTDPAAHMDYFSSFKSAQEYLSRFPMPRVEDVAEAELPPDEDISGNTIDAEVVNGNWDTTATPTPKPAERPSPTPPAAPKPQPQPEPEPEERVISTVGKVRQPVAAVPKPSPAAGTVQIGDDEEPPF